MVRGSRAHLEIKDIYILRKNNEPYGSSHIYTHTYTYIYIYIYIYIKDGMITGFQVNHGLEKSRFQNHKKLPLYGSCGMHNFF